jgi:diketogulonate reductase-like aldo/keto reductase
MNHEKLLPLAQKYGKSVVQVVFKWLLQQDVIIIPKTWEHKHMLENISLWDFTISDEDMAIIDSIDNGKFLNYNPYTATKGFKKYFKKWSGFNG